jgi:hypothetical protein
LEHVICSIIYGIILPIDQYFSRWVKPPTSIVYIWEVLKLGAPQVTIGFRTNMV